MAQVEESVEFKTEGERDAIEGRGKRPGSGASRTWSGDGDELHVLEFGSWEEAMSNVGRPLTTTKWIDRVKKNDDGREFVRSRPVSRDFKPRREGRCVRGDAALLAYVAGVHEKHRQQGQRSETHVHRREESAHQRDMW